MTAVRAARLYALALLLRHAVAVASAYAPVERGMSDQNKTKTAAIFFILYSLFSILYSKTLDGGDIYQRREPVLK